MPPRDNDVRSRFEFLSAVFHYQGKGYYNITVYGVDADGLSAVNEVSFNAMKETILKALKTIGYRTNAAAADLIIKSGGNYDNLVLTVVPIY